VVRERVFDNFSSFNQRILGLLPETACSMLPFSFESENRTVRGILIYGRPGIADYWRESYWAGGVLIEVLRYLGKLEPEDEEENEELDLRGRSPEELRAMTEGYMKHAEELRRYLASRRAARESLPLSDEAAVEGQP
jgi:hypothetical protein